MATTIIVVGGAMVAVSIARGGGALSTGTVFGVAFVALGAARLYVALR